MNAAEFWSKVEALCLLFDCSVTSGIRTRKHNEAVGGASRSRHMLRYGLAADLKPDKLTRANKTAIKDAAYKLGFDFVQIDDHHVHVQVNRLAFSLKGDPGLVS